MLAFFNCSGKEFQSFMASNVRTFLLKLVDIACRVCVEAARFSEPLVNLVSQKLIQRELIIKYNVESASS